MPDFLSWDWHNPATIFTALYGVARIVSHLTPSYTIVGKACAWILGNVPNANPPLK
jgi:hypothetical protein